MNETIFAIFNQTLKPEILVIKGKTIIEGTLQANWIQSWNIGIIMGIVSLLVIWNIIITWRLSKMKGSIKTKEEKDDNK